MEDLISLAYQSDLNEVSENFPLKTVEFLRGISSGKTLEIFSSVVREVSSAQGVKLGAIFSSRNFVESFAQSEDRFSLLVYPLDRIEVDYQLRTDRYFLSNIHEKPDPIYITNMRYNIFLLKDSTEQFVWMHGPNKGRGGTWVPNHVSSIFLFKNNPFNNSHLYPGFVPKS